MGPLNDTYVHSAYNFDMYNTLTVVDYFSLSQDMILI